jgi:flagellar secretion chaperone FliS
LPYQSDATRRARLAQVAWVRADIQGSPQPKTTPMFATATVHAPHAGAGAYRQVGVVTGVSAASPHQLVLMLFDGFDEALAQALGSLRDGAIEAKCSAITRAARIVDEGLRANLDLNGGGALAADLRELYAYVGLRLVKANLDNDAAGIEECRRLMRPLREAWASIATQAA